MKNNNIGNGADYLIRATHLLVTPQLRWFVLVPVAINLVLFFIATALLIQQFETALQWLLGSLPSWLEFIGWILWVLFAALVLLVYGYSFSLITNLLAAPFYGLLAEKTEILARGEGPPSEPLAKMIPRTFVRELVKLWYFLWRGLLVALLVLLLSFIPGLNIVGVVIGFLWGAWNMVIQYSDYAADNNRLSFKSTRKRLSNHQYSSFGLGGLIMLGTMIPLANIFVVPIAVIAGTLYWVDELRHMEP